MPAPKGNKFAAKLNPKGTRLGFRVDAATRVKLEQLAAVKKLSISQTLELLIVREYERKFEKNTDKTT